MGMGVIQTYIGNKIISKPHFISRDLLTPLMASKYFLSQEIKKNLTITGCLFLKKMRNRNTTFLPATSHGPIDDKMHRPEKCISRMHMIQDLPLQNTLTPTVYLYDSLRAGICKDLFAADDVSSSWVKMMPTCRCQGILLYSSLFLFSVCYCMCLYSTDLKISPAT